MITRDEARRLDEASPLAHTPARFDLPDGVLYLDGNSLGPTVVGLSDHLTDVVRREWGRGLIRSWNPLPDGGGE
ncbi:MAG: kynureninase, partial [Myxococcales bacterium]